MNLFRSFNVEDLRLNLKLAETRIEQLKNKKINMIKKQRNEIVALLRENRQEELARIRTEHMVREDFNIEVLGIIALHCALLKERTKLLETSPTIPFDMRQCIATLVYAADRVNDIPELSKIRSQLMLKYKKEVTTWLSTEEKIRESVNERVYERLSPKPPNAFIVTSYMKHIAEENNLDWRPSEDLSDVRFDQPPAAPTGASVTAGAGSGIRAPYYVTDGSLSSNPMQGVVESMFKPTGGGGAGGPSGSAAAATVHSSGKVPSLFDTPVVQAPAHPPGQKPVTQPPAHAPTADKKNTLDAAPEFVVLGESTPGRNLFPPAAPVTNNAGAVPDFDELQARFEALRRGE